jgi:hypothetical protein
VSFSDDSDSDSQSDDEKEMPKFQRDRSLEALFVDIPKVACYLICCMHAYGLTA